jgi:RNA recognition motif-containing protein
VDPRTKESRGFAFVKMASADDAERCIKYLNRTVIEGRRIMIERVLYYHSFSSSLHNYDLPFAEFCLWNLNIFLLILGKKKP